ncbi:MAG: alcohol dehydrogenase catalytic domain-containing protein, partial [Pseudomonadota bacterium]|nr:alcohol dehydrogenase catalytic domain-containing protein [Pseudomonadota bacterium]
MKAIRVNEHGGPEVLAFVDVDTPCIGEGEVLLKIESAGINFIDTYQRSGLYQIPLPSTLGLEAAGTVVETGANVTGLNIGDRVAYTNVAGAYAEFAAVPADKLVAIPEGVSFDQGAA